MRSRRRGRPAQRRGSASRYGGSSTPLSRRVMPVLLVLVVLALGYFLFSLHQVRGGMKALNDGRVDVSRARFERANAMGLLAGGAEEGFALLDLEGEAYSEAEAGLQEARERLLRFSGLDGEGHFQRYFERGDYRAMAILGEHLAALGQSGDELDFHLGSAYCGLNRLDEARRHLAVLERPGVFAHREEAQKLIELVEDKVRRGSHNAVLDRSGVPLVTASLDTLALEPGESGFSSLLGLDESDREGLRGILDERARWNVTRLTIDGDIQRAAAKALSGSTGAVVVLAPATGDVLAAASNYPGVGTDSPHSVFTRSYEPASVIKLITLAAALEDGGLERFNLFPFQCAGNTTIEGKLFYDWRRHGTVKHIDHAMAISCNLLFARIGLLLGKSRIEQKLEDFLFGGRIDGTLLPMAVGTFEGKSTTPYEVANLAVGLDYLRTTPIHLAMIASAIGNRGMLMKPRLLIGRDDILGRPITETIQVELGRILEEEHASFITDTMFEVVESSEGTGRRAAVDGLALAVKTGTGGDKDKGLDGVMIGFAPAHEPKIAFAIVLEGAGKAELAAARTVKSLLESILYKLSTAPLEEPATP